MRYPAVCALIAGFVMSVFLSCCGSSKQGLFGSKKTPHEKYGDAITAAGLDKTTMGTRWFAAAQNSLLRPHPIGLPYKDTGYFAADQPSAAGYVFEARRGSLLRIDINVTPGSSRVFAELWEPGDRPDDRHLLSSADSTLTISYTAEKNGSYILRLQPALLEGVEYAVSIIPGPSLAFPVSEAGRPRLISFWSDARDKGRKKPRGRRYQRILPHARARGGGWLCAKCDGQPVGRKSRIHAS